MISFAKMSGAGNTFVVIDNRQGQVDQALENVGSSMDRFVIRLCSAVHGTGSDGLILLQDSARHDFSWRFFNADGSTANMCGNGARCAARFAYISGISGPNTAFETGAGVIHAHTADGQVRVTLTAPGAVGEVLSLRLGGNDYQGQVIDTGVPHLVVPVADVGEVSVEILGAEARYDERFAPDGVNVNFAALTREGALKVRTYERGVEGETMACGTGVTAAALVFSALGKVSSPVTVLPLSGDPLIVRFNPDDLQGEVSIEGSAQVLFKGEIDPAVFA